MGTKVQCESYFQGHFAMRDLSENSNRCNWPLYYGDKTVTSRQYDGGLLPSSVADAYPGYDKAVVKQTMIEHESIFKNQLHELHRLYRIQRDLMDEVKRKEVHKTSFSSSPLASQIMFDDARKWHIPNFPLASSVCATSSNSDVEDIRSPLSSMKGTSAQASPLPSQNEGILKDMEMEDSRPSKVRRKMLDLRLPADGYIDSEGDKLRDENLSRISSYLPNGNHKITLESGTNLFLGNDRKNNCQRDSSRAALFLSSTNYVADLNKPSVVEDIDTSSYVDCIGSTSSSAEIRRHELAPNKKSEFIGFPKDMPLNTSHGTANGALNNGKDWFSHILDAGQNKNNLQSVSQSFQSGKLHASSQPTQILLNRTHEPPTLFPTDQVKGSHWRETTCHGLDFFKRNNEISNNYRPESVVTSYLSSSYPIGPSDMGKSLSQSVSSCDKSSGSLSQKSSAVQMHSFFNSSATLSRSLQSSNQTHRVVGDRWNYNSDFASNPSFGSEMPNRNGFYYGSSSGTKEPLVRFPSVNHDYLNCNSADNIISDHFNNHYSAKFYKSSDCVDSKSPKDRNLNLFLSNVSSKKAAPQPVIEVIDLERKHDDHLVALPWLRAKLANKNETTDARIDLNEGEVGFMKSSLPQLSDKNEKGESSNQIAIQNLKSASCANVEASRIKISNFSSCRKILGFPIFEKEHNAKNGSSFNSPPVYLPHPPEREVENSSKNSLLDINLPCDPEIPDFGQQAAVEVKPNHLKHLIDLNSCASEDEVSLVPSGPDSHVKNIVRFDLEAPAVPETEEDVIPAKECLQKAQVEAPLELLESKAESLQDELVRVAAEAIVAISLSGCHNHVDEATGSPSEVSMTDPLHWFVKIVSLFGEDLESKLDTFSGAKYGEHNEESSSEEIDYFESMTLKLIETKEKDYMPKPVVPDYLKLEETGTTPLQRRTRRGQGRRGRQRRDFQRDILPGLVSLSRHEVTEDLQTFGGLMRAKGHLWHSGLTRRNTTRNGCGRGRRRLLVSPLPTVAEILPCTPPLMQQLNTIKVGLEERSLTGWGKTTRRPRRQRCPAGNPIAIPST